jgi:hypothetical protein
MIIKSVRKATSINMQCLLVLVLCSVFLSGCESRAELKDVEPTIREFWSTCSFVKIEKLRKVNGLSRGEEYVLSIAYDLVVQFEVAPEEDKWGSASALSQNCNGEAQMMASGRLKLQHFGYQKGWKQGQVLSVANEYTLVHSENGWVLSSAL